MLELGGGPVPVLTLGVACVFEVTGGTVGLYDCGEGRGGGYEEGFHGEGELAEAVEARVCAIGDCSSLDGMLAFGVGGGGGDCFRRYIGTSGGELRMLEAP